MISDKEIKISILIPVYNAAATLAQTLDSALSQDMRELEIICVNDASTDESMNILTRYAGQDERIKIIDLPQKSGTNFARKTAVLAAAGKYAMFLDADDRLMPHSCSTAYQKISEVSADIFHFGTELVFADGVSEDIKGHVSYFLDFSGSDFLRGSKAILNSIYVDRLYTWNVWNKIYRTGLLLEALPHITDKNVVFAEDYYSTFIVCSFARSMLVEDIKLYQYRCGGGISTDSSSQKRLSAMISAYSLKDELILFCNSDSILCRDEEIKQCICSFFDETFLRIADNCSDLVFQTLLKSYMKEIPGVSKLLDAFCCRYAAVKACYESSEKIRTDFVELEAGYRKLEKGYHERGEQYAALFKEQQEQLKRFEQLKKTFQYLKEFCKKLKNDNRAASTVYEQLSSDYREQSQQLEHYKKIFSDLETGYRTLENAYKQLASQYEHLHLEHFEQIKLSARQQERQSSLEQTNSALQKEKQEQILQYEHLNKNFQGQSQLFEQKVSQLAHLEEKFELLTDEYKNEQEKCNSLQADFRQQIHKSEQQQKQFSDLENGYRLLEQEYCRQRMTNYMNKKEFAYWQRINETLKVWHNPYRLSKFFPLSKIQFSRLARLKFSCMFNSRKFAAALLSDTVYFDCKWYKEKYAQFITGDTDAVSHYLDEGWQQEFDPSPYFSTSFYLRQVPELAELKINPLVHFICCGIFEARRVQDTTLPAGYMQIASSPLFDENYYCSQLSAPVDDPIEHYREYGWKMGLNPSAAFNNSIYFANNPDVFELQINPLEHYLMYGRDERRIYENVFSDALPDLYDTLKNSGLFDAEYYRTTYLGNANFIDPLWHYILCGWKQKFNPSAQFWTQGYLNIYLDIADIELPALYHYLKWGRYEGRERVAVDPEAQEFMPEKFDIKGYSQKQNKILLIVHQMDISGVPALACSIAEAFADISGAAVVSPFDGEYRNQALKRNVPVYIDPGFFTSPERINYYLDCGFSSCIFLTIGVAGAFVLHSSKIPSVMWINDNMTADNMSKYMRETLAKQSNFYAASELTRKCVSTYASDVKVLPYPIKDKSRREKKKFNCSKVRFAVIGRLEERKAQDIAIKAFVALPQNLRKNAQLDIIGSTIMPEFKNKLLKLSEKHENIIFRDASANPEVYQSWFKDIDVLISPSLNDPMPLVVVDAMMHGCPVIISSAVGQCEYIVNGKNGFVFESGNVEKLTQCMSKILSETENLTEMSENIRQTFMENFEYKKAVSAIQNAIRAAADKHKTGNAGGSEA